ncbi:hypothetical protein D5086_031775 [Populus alba]|uniref:Uncharacterized protein n=1 Tax=Populus alba TaxID=43335 RepID=A0ACC4AJM9_POPAL
MLFIEGLWELLYLDHFQSQAQAFSGVLFEAISKSMSNSSCGSSELEICRDHSSALILKLIAIASILFGGIIGIAIPIIGKHRHFLKTDGSLFVAAKAFAAGVILATGFVHMLSAASEALSDPCLPEYPWKKFPFSGFFAMMASLLTLLLDFVGTQYYERKQGLNKASEEQVRVGSVDANPGHESGIIPIVEVKELNGSSGKVFGEEEHGGMHIVGMHAHAAHHRHNHSHGQDGCDGLVSSRDHGHAHGSGHEHGHEHGEGDEESGLRHVVVSQAQFKTLSTTIMACFFAITTPAGIGIGTAISSFYNPNSPRALAAEGILDSLSAGILVYMALVDLIAADFLSKRMSCNFRLQVVSYCMLFLGAGLMSSLAVWA